jgi:hypothetical protein
MTDLATTKHNEKTKLTATWINGAAIALLAVGGFAPSISYISSTDHSRSVGSLTLTFIACLIMSGVLHFGARKVLGLLR